jgi:hypothetical protein
MNNYRLYETIKNDMKKQLKEYEKIVQYNEQDMDFHETIGLEKKLQMVRDKLKMKQETKSRSTSPKPKVNRSSNVEGDSEIRYRHSYINQ